MSSGPKSNVCLRQNRTAVGCPGSEKHRGFPLCLFIFAHSMAGCWSGGDPHSLHLLSGACADHPLYGLHVRGHPSHMPAPGKSQPEAKGSCFQVNISRPPPPPRPGRVSP